MNKKDAIWITGASSGIGKALTKKFIETNLKIIGSARNTDPIKKIFNEELASDKVQDYQCDVSSFEQVARTVNQIEEKYKVNCLINNAGVTSFKPFIENSIADIQNIINTNLLGSIYTTKSVLPGMIKNNSGTIINVLSVAAKTVFKNSSVYSASKAGLENFAKVLREEIRENNIRIINIFPGATVSGIWPESALDKFSKQMMTAENLAEFIFTIYKSEPALSPEEIVVRPISGDL